jgi:ribonuclease R
MTTKPQPRLNVHGITIDGPSSVDLDDAIWVEEAPIGYQIQVHIADVAERVPPSSPADTKAIERTQTLYRKSSIRPMLPRPLEAELSLVEGETKLTLTFAITLNHQGAITNTEIFETLFTNLKRFSYAEADHTLQDPCKPFHTLLQLAQTITQLLSQHRQQQGAIGGISVPGGWLDEEGRLFTDGFRFHAPVIIQELMILANQAVAEWLVARDLPALYRNHSARLVAPESGEMLPALLSLGSFESVRKQLQHWLDRAEYAPTVKGHFALALPAYCHATSPIRRVADLITHRVIKAHLHQQPQPYTKSQLQELGQHIAKVNTALEASSKQFFRDRAEAESKAVLEAPQDLAQLSEDEFSRVLKFALRQGDLDPLTAELTDRLDQGNLVVLDLYLLIIANNIPHWQKLTLAHLCHRLNDAPTILSMACSQELDWQGYAYHEFDSSYGCPQFTCWADVTISGTPLTTRQGTTRPRKQLARQNACLAWLSAYVAGELIPADQRELPAPPQDKTATGLTEVAGDFSGGKGAAVEPVDLDLPETDSGQPFASTLNDLCQKRGWPTPPYRFAETDEGFCCQCSLELPQGTLTGTGYAKRKQTAKHRAARAVLEQVQKDTVCQIELEPLCTPPQSRRRNP